MRLVVIILLSYFSTVAFAQEQSTQPNDPIELCGEIASKQTRYDGVQTIFFSKDEGGNIVKQYYLKATANPSAPDHLPELPKLILDTAVPACIVGIPSRKIMFDSPRPFYVFEIRLLVKQNKR